MFELQAALYARLVDRGEAEVTVFRDARTPFAFPGLKVEGVRAGFGPFSHRLEKSLGVCPYRSARTRLEGFDVIETSDPTLYAYPRVALAAAKRSGARLVCGSSVTLPGLRGAAVARARVVMDAASAILCTTPLARQRFTALGLLKPRDPRVVLTGHPVDTEVFRPPDPDRREAVILTVCRLEEAKGLIEALEAFRETPDHWSWHIVGTGPLESPLQKAVASLGLENRVEFLGSVPHQDMAGLYARASILLHLPRSTPSWEEYFGAVLIEAMACGVAVLGNRTGALPHVVGEGGLLVHGPAGEDLRCLTSDADLRRTLGRRGRDRVMEHFHIDRVADRFLRAWHGKARQAPSPGPPEALGVAR